MPPYLIPEHKTYPCFDLIRMLLALEVVVAHTWGTVIPGSGWPGFIMAVPAFLAVSGFLVLKSYSQAPSWRLFAKKRALRIFPALAVSILLGYLLFDAKFLKNSLITWITAGVYVPVGLTNNPLWSLGWEELTYAFLAILWTLGAYKRPIFIWMLLGVSCLLSWKVTDIPLTPFWQIVSFLGPAFFTGNLVYIYRQWISKLGGFLPWFFLLLIMYWGVSSPPVLQAFSVVWVGMSGRNPLPWKMPDISYGMYVYHWPILYFLVVGLGYKSPLTVSLILAVSLLPLSIASWYLIERPALRLKEAYIRKPFEKATAPSTKGFKIS